MRGNPRHPGESLREDWIEPHGLSVAEAAEHMGVSATDLLDVCECRAPITAELAVRIDLVFGGGADTWLALQSGYSLAQARAGLAGETLRRFEAEASGSMAEVAD